MNDLIGQTILHYKIIEQVGRGGMGIVYKAHDIKLDRIMALKFLPQYLSSDPNEKERFYHEARAAASLTHQNVAVIYEIGEHEQNIFLAMEYVEGKTLKKLVEQESESLSLKKVLEIAIQICEGIDAAHEKGIVHRDIKSDNIMITPKGQVKVMDFGLAKLKGASRLTQAGSTVGTAAYMSPEQAQGEDVDHRSDIFSFGVVLYELLTTHLPFRGEHQAALLYSLINENPQPIARFNDKVSEDLERIIFKALAKDKDERYQHVDDMLADLRKERKNLEYARSGYIKAPALQPVSTEKSNGGRNRINKKTLRIFIPSAVVVLIAVVSFFFNPFKSQVTENQASEISRNSLAVMYFENIPDPEDKNHNSEMLTNLLITSLSQVKGLEVISRERLLDIQKDLGKTETKSISSSFANQVATRAGVTTMLIGSILQEKPMLTVTTRLIDVQNGKIISSQQLTNFAANQIFNLVDSLTILIQNDLLSASAEEIKSVAEVTTKSPEAYRAFVTGLELLGKLYWRESTAAFSRAIELDKNFAMAYYYLSNAQNRIGEFESARRSFNKAVELADNASERERLQIRAANYEQQNNLPKAIERYEQLIERYPHEINPYVQLGILYAFQLLDPEKAVDVFRQGLKIEPSAKTLWNLMAYSLARLNRKKEALEAVNKYINLAPAEPNPYDTQGDVYAWFMDYDSSRASYQKAMNLRVDFASAYKLGYDAVLKQRYNDAKKFFDKSGLLEPLIEVHLGKLHLAEKKLKEIPDSEISVFDRLLTLIHLYYEMGKYPEMLQQARQLSMLKLKKEPTDIIYGRDYLAWALIKNGESSEAHSLIAKMQNDVSNGPQIVQVIADYSSALAAFEEEKNQQALEKFRKVFQRLPPNHEPNIFYSIALLKTGQISEAIEEFQRLKYWSRTDDIFIISTLPGARFDWSIAAVKTHYWLGAAYEMQGNNDKALNEFRKFVDIWKDADFNSPEITEAKAQILKLEGITKK